ncbi:hypothetical protein CAOG_05477 [Capsaspora owczarzaki ATCC 30864]|uniref:hypothetical protein n=1 Tax=Capsaspora owczarzaki (strain ATCC 30864) TaxID=595528 RepID=UPI000352649C|nr:hypothetical protein CAOG_05477 [Capsaspora owczarzaki ATCC 30864]|eukprot:XP_004346150.2 hypothetical protein CAOG_05477 [Capsaspora owczarzaki ATCC 30864]
MEGEDNEAAAVPSNGNGNGNGNGSEAAVASSVHDRLNRKLQSRPDKKDLVANNIMKQANVSPALLNAQTELNKARMEERLNKKLSTRPAKETLVSNNIMKGGDPNLLARQTALNRSLIERTLEMRLAEKYGRRWASLSTSEAAPLVEWNRRKSASLALHEASSGAPRQSLFDVVKLARAASDKALAVEQQQQVSQVDQAAETTTPAAPTATAAEATSTISEAISEEDSQPEVRAKTSGSESKSKHLPRSNAIDQPDASAGAERGRSNSSGGSVLPARGPPLSFAQSPMRKKRRGGLSSRSVINNTYARFNRQLSISSRAHKSDFIIQIEQSGRFVCHNCCSEDGLGPEFNSSRYSYNDFFNEKDWDKELLQAPTHYAQSRSQKAQELEEGVCDNCGSLAPLTCNQPRTAPEFPKPVFKEDIKGRRQQQLSKHSHLDRIERIARASVTSSGEEDDDETQSKYRRRSRLSSGSEIGSDTDEVSGVPSLSSSPVPTSPPLADQPLATPAAQTARSLPGTGDDASDSDDDQPPLRRRKIKFGDDLVMGEYDRYRYLNVFVDECLFTFVNPETGERGIAVEGSNPPIILPILESDTYFDFFQREANGDLFAISRRCISDVAEDLVRSASPVVGDGSGSATSPPSSGPSTPKLSQVVFPSNNSPKNISRVYLVDKVNHNLLYFADKKLGEYFAWKTDSGDVFQVS